jgi:hypothetical protein
MRDPAASVGRSTTLRELAIDHLDLPMICLDVEDAFDVHMGNAVQIEDLATVDDLVGVVASCLEEKAKPRVRTPRRKGGWMSTGTESRR